MANPVSFCKLSRSGKLVNRINIEQLKSTLARPDLHFMKTTILLTIEHQLHAQLLKRVPPAWEKAFEVNPAQDAGVRASCVEFVLAGLYVTDRISRSQRHGIITYEIV